MNVKALGKREKRSEIVDSSTVDEDENDETDGEPGEEMLFFFI